MYCVHLNLTQWIFRNRGSARPSGIAGRARIHEPLAFPPFAFFVLRPLFATSHLAKFLELMKMADSFPDCVTHGKFHCPALVAVQRQSRSFPRSLFVCLLHFSAAYTTWFQIGTYAVRVDRLYRQVSIVERTTSSRYQEKIYFPVFRQKDYPKFVVCWKFSILNIKYISMIEIRGIVASIMIEDSLWDSLWDVILFLSTGSKSSATQSYAIESRIQ